jgi:hypothetical protein
MSPEHYKECQRLEEEYWRVQGEPEPNLKLLTRLRLRPSLWDLRTFLEDAYGPSPEIRELTLQVKGKRIPQNI